MNTEKKPGAPLSDEEILHNLKQAYHEVESERGDVMKQEVAEIVKRRLLSARTKATTRRSTAKSQSPAK